MSSVFDWYSSLSLEQRELITMLGLALYMAFIAYMAEGKGSKSKRHAMFYFAYCDGSVRNVVAREPVSSHQFYYYDEYVGLPVLHMTKECIYFKLQDC